MLDHMKINYVLKFKFFTIPEWCSLQTITIKIFHRFTIQITVIHENRSKITLKLM